MIEPTNDEISFLQKLVLRSGELALQGPMSLLKIERLIPDMPQRRVPTSGV